MFKKEFQKFKENYVTLDNDENKHLETDYTKNNNLLIIFIKNKKLMISLKNSTPCCKHYPLRNKLFTS